MWLKSCWRWLSEALWGLLFSSFFIIFLCFAFRYHTVDFFRWTGGLFQFLGMIFTIQTWRLVRSYFKQPPALKFLWKTFIEWIKRFPTRKGRRVSLNGCSENKAYCEATASLWMPDHPKEPIEGRIDRILGNLELLKKSDFEQASSIKELQNKLEEYKKEDVARDKKQDEQNLKDMEFQYSGKLAITSLMGIFLLCVGIVISTAAPELSELLK
jgi:hypothetical protein